MSLMIRKSAERLADVTQMFVVGLPLIGTRQALVVMVASGDTRTHTPL